MKLDIYIITVNKEKVKLDPVKFIVHLVINMGGWIYHRYLYPNFNIFSPENSSRSFHYSNR